ncbi:MAG: leucyl/phenylalanyl-tRNA--protein transferase [Proteobacteria bacterium]|nr:leucyl/phenylalanyl-tRNA--protein transferase [Pseudomonadota bacterium]
MRPLLRLWIADLLDPHPRLPDPENVRGGNGLAGIARDLSVESLLAAYGRGLYPGGHVAPTKWLSPPERCVLFFNEIHIGKQVRRAMRQARYTVTFDHDFDAVIKACAARRKGRWHVTWIRPEIMRAYAALHDAGHAHSFEVWNSDGKLAGGGYGVACGRVFSTESQFSLEPNTSKLGFTLLNWHLARWGIAVNDGKNPTPTLLDMGFRSIPRSEFRRYLADVAMTDARVGKWAPEADLKEIAAWNPAMQAPHARPSPPTAPDVSTATAEIATPTNALSGS